MKNRKTNSIDARFEREILLPLSLSSFWEILKSRPAKRVSNGGWQCGILIQMIVRTGD